MSVEFYPASGSGGNDASLGGTTVGGSKPLHRFIRWQPKIVGNIVLILGASFAIISIALNVQMTLHNILTVIPRGVLLGSLSFISGIVFILTEDKPTKKTVTISLALCIVTILGALWSLLNAIPDFIQCHYFRSYYYSDDNSTETDSIDWYSHTWAMGLAVEVIFTVYTLVCIVIFIVMSCLAGAALRSTQSQAVIVMTTAPTETPVE